MSTAHRIERIGVTGKIFIEKRTHKLWMFIEHFLRELVRRRGENSKKGIIPRARGSR